MRLYRHFTDYKDRKQGLALAIGNFDGFHQGHRAVIEHMRKAAHRHGLKSAVMIFEPQPLEYFGRAVPPRLFSLRDKLKAFASCSLDAVFCVPFTKAFCSLSPEHYVDLLQQLNVRVVVVGSLFTFGHNGAAVFEDLKRLCAERGIEADAISAVARSGVRVSSTQIRALLGSGELSCAAQMIGRPFVISGRVVRGQQLGRSLGFPTANVNLRRLVCPLDGVYAVRVRTPEGWFDGVANVGSRPTVSGKRALLEVYLFDFASDLYGREIEVYFLDKLRGEVKFSDLSSLTHQLKADKAKAQCLLPGLKARYAQLCPEFSAVLS